MKRPRPEQRRADRCSLVEPLERRALLSMSPLGGEFRANTVTANYQVAPRVASADDGRFVAVWSSTAQAGPAAVVGQDIYARIYDSSGTPLGDEFLVNTHTSNHQTLPSVAMDNAGNFVVVWHSQDQDGGGLGVYGQVLSSTGAPVGGEFRVNIHTSGDQAYPTVAMDADGDFVVAWESGGGQDGQGYGVFARRYNPAGTSQGGEFVVNNTTSGDQYSTSVASDDAGNFIVAWSSDQLGSFDVHARRFTANGASLGNEFRVNTYTTDAQNFAWIAADASGDFVVVWQSDEQDSNFYGVYAQRYTAAGAPAGAEFRVNTFVPFYQQFPSVAMTPAGDFVVVWESLNQDGSFFGVYGQAFRADGTPRGSEFRANTYLLDDQSYPSVAVGANGRAVVAWQSRSQDGSLFGVYAQRYLFDTVPPTVLASEFRYQTAPHALRITFSEDVSGSLSSFDVGVLSLASGLPQPVQLAAYDSATNTATFTFPAAFNGVLNEARYRATVFASGISDGHGNAMAANISFDFLFLRGDANNDGIVNLADFNTLAANFGLSNRNFSQGDFNYDTIVNLADFNILAGKFGTSIAPARSGTAQFSTNRTEQPPRLIHSVLDENSISRDYH